MAFIVNDQVLRSVSYSEDIVESKIASSVVQNLGLKFSGSRVMLSLSVSARSGSSSWPFRCMMSCVVDDSLNSAELVLGTDWLKRASPVLGGLDVNFNNETVHVPIVSSAMHAHAGDAVSSSSCSVPSSSVEGSSFSISSDSLRRCQALEIISDAFLRDFHHGARTSVFSSSIDSLHNTLQLHGIQSDGLSVCGCQDALIAHYASGKCFDNSCRAPLDQHEKAQQRASPYLDGALREMSTCSNIASEFAS